MPRKSKKNRKTRQPAKPPQAPPRKPPKSEMPSDGASGTSRFWNVPKKLITALTLIVGLLSAKQLLPKMSVSRVPPLDDRIDFPSFAITNGGYFRVTDVYAGCYIVEATNGTDHFERGDLCVDQGPGINGSLDENQTMTVDVGYPYSLRWFNAIDMDVIVYYRPWPWPFSLIRLHSLQRLVGHLGPRGWEWVQQPPGDTERAVNAMEDRMAQLTK